MSKLKKGNLSLILNLLIFSFFAVFVVIGSDVILNQKLENMERILTNPTDIIGKLDNVLIFLGLIPHPSANNCVSIPTEEDS